MSTGDPPWTCSICGTKPCKCPRIKFSIPLPKADVPNKNDDVFTQEAIDNMVLEPKSFFYTLPFPNVYGPVNQRLRDEKYQFPKEVWNDPRPSWDAYFMSEAFRVSRRSLDKDTKHGCVFVRDKRIVSTGYNSPPPGFDDAKADLERPGKYIIMEHSERAAICNAARAGVSTLDAICYVTGFPCSDCYRAMWSAGIKEVIYSPINLSAQYSAEHISYLEAARLGPKLTKFTKERMKEVIKILDDEYDYIMERIDFNTPDESPST